MSGSDLVSVNLTKKIVHVDDGDVPITSMYDFEGDQTDDADEACVIVAQDPKGAWRTIDLRGFSERTLH